MKIILAAAAALAALTATAVAADLPVKARPMMAPIPYSWTGCYLAGGGGYGMWDQQHRTQSDPAFTTTLTDASQNIDSGGRGWFGTVQGGCDYQVNQSWVVGAFADYDFADISGRFAPGYPSYPYQGNEKLSWQWAVGGRVGYLVLPNLLAYISGGYTQAHFNSAHLFTNTVPSSDIFVQLNSKTYDGFFLGSGYEYGLNWLSPNLFWKTEYRFASFGSENPQYFSTITGTTANALREHSTMYVQTIRSELVWRFNWR